MVGGGGAVAVCICSITFFLYDMTETRQMLVS